ncbi:hypothetical protein B0H66DRAFT_598091 [Apodospora peruviana]|uniref:Uncharacterized protein n=1 Tax=Apodospora peruviana TaxID=516989 RepID=A0AAE0MGX8_9PEZI|nr:hypothetical protein B0H66DRAFT_598091 [Apodospora peruviana]
MFCIQDPEHHSGHHDHHRRILRTFRSHKSLRSGARSQDMIHQRHPSDASSLSLATTRSSTESSRPSTGRTDKSVDWDPLRLHPPMATSHLPFTQSHNDNKNHEIRTARSLHNLHHGHHQNGRAHMQQSPSQSTTTVIYDGFDFGFSGGQKQSFRRRREPMQDYDGVLDYYEDSSSGPSSASGSDFGPTTPSDVHGPAEEWGDAVTPRPHPAGMDAADYFIRRGGWKRRGIVFATELRDPAVKAGEAPWRRAVLGVPTNTGDAHRV